MGRKQLGRATVAHGNALEPHLRMDHIIPRDRDFEPLGITPYSLEDAGTTTIHFGSAFRSELLKLVRVT